MATVSSPISPVPAEGGLLTQFVPDEVLYEVVDNQIRVLPPMGVRENLLTATFMRILGTFAWNHDLGHVIAETLFLLAPPPRNLQRRPDLAFVSFDRWPRKREIGSVAAWEVVPNLAIEIVSPTNGANEIVEKIEDYFNAGVECVWVVYPTVKKVYVYDSVASVRIVTRAQSLQSGTELPGFEIPLAEIFPEETYSEESPPQ
jgi:Uma2 family endonuclease